MRNKYILLLIFCMFLSACATSEKNIGSEAWYNKRMAEIETSYKNKEIDEAKYLELKNEVGAIRAEHMSGRSNAYTHFGFGSDGGGSVGIGVGF